MLEHNDVPIDAPGGAATSVCQTAQKQVVDFERVEVGASAITAEGKEMGLAGLVKAMETAWHETEDRLSPDPIAVTVEHSSRPGELAKPARGTWGTRRLWLRQS